MARTRRIKRDGDAHYHLMSRTNDRRFLFSKGRVKGEIVSLLRRDAAFSRYPRWGVCVVRVEKGGVMMTDRPVCWLSCILGLRFLL